MSKRHKKYAKRLTRFCRLSKARGMRWAVKHVDREVGNACRAYRVLMGECVAAKSVKVGLVCSLMLKIEDWQLSSEVLSA